MDNDDSNTHFEGIQERMRRKFSLQKRFSLRFMRDEEDFLSPQTKRFEQLVSEFRLYSRKHVIGSSLEGDKKCLDYLFQIGNKENRDNLDMPSKPVKMCKYIQQIRPFKESEKPIPPERTHGLRISAEELGITPEELEDALPIPPDSIYLPVGTSKKTMNSLGKASLGKKELGGEVSFKKLKQHLTDNKEVLDPSLIGLLLRTYRCGKTISEQDLNRIIDYMISMPNESFKDHQLRAVHLFNSVGKKKKTGLYNSLKKEVKTAITKQHQENPTLLEKEDIVKPRTEYKLKFDKYFLTFGCTDNKLCKVKVPVEEELTVKNHGKTTLKFTFLDHPTTTHQIEVCTRSGELKKGQSLKISVKLTVLRPVRKIIDVLVMELECGLKYFIGINVGVQNTKFGVPVRELQTAYVEGRGDIPVVLLKLKNSLYKHNGLAIKGIFRHAGNEKTISEVKEQLNLDIYEDCSDVHVVANLIKIWFREMDECLLNFLTAKQITEHTSEDPYDCYNLVSSIKEPNKTLLEWLLDLMVDIVKHSSENAMTSTNVAIVFSPNLYRSDVKSPMLMIMIAQRLATILNGLIQYRLMLEENQEGSSQRSEGSSESQKTK